MENSWFRFAQEQVILPRVLYYLVLPLKLGQKLLFGLCRFCIKRNSYRCAHSAEAVFAQCKLAGVYIANAGMSSFAMFEITNEERALSDFWGTLMFEQAIAKNY